MTSKGTKKPYIHFLSNAAVDVTGSCHHVRFKKYSTLLDCGMIQGMGDIVSDYKANLAQLKKIKSRDVDFIILNHSHLDHVGLVPALYAKGCNAHLYVPSGSTDFLKLLWEDSLKIMRSDCLKIQNKHGQKAAPFYDEQAIERALNRIIEVDYNTPIQLSLDIKLTYYPAGHIINSAQCVLELKDGYVTKRIGFTSDIGGAFERPYKARRQTLPFVDVLISECTYCQQGRPNSPKDRDKDIEKIKAVIAESNKILVPCFSLDRTQSMLRLLHDEGIDKQIKIYLDSPLASKFCAIWPWEEDELENVQIVESQEESLNLQMRNEHCLIISASGFLVGGRIMSHLKTALPDSHNHILFCGFAGENGLASQIKSNMPEVNIDGMNVANKANITELRSFSSHASYEELIDYLTNQCRFNKLCLVHGNYENKVEFANTLQDELIKQGKSSRVVCTQQDQRIFI